MRILLIDDSKPLLKTLGSGLQRYGQTVLTASSGYEGIEIFKTNQVDAVICDLGMESMDGWQVAELVKEICENEGRPKTTFILLTGWGAEISTDEQISSSGVDIVLEKPIEIPHLMEVLADRADHTA